MTDTAMEIWREADQAAKDAHYEAVRAGAATELVHKAAHEAAAAVIARHIPQGGDGLVDEHPEWGSVEAKVETYNEFHEIALGMGFPSMTEAFEQLGEDATRIAQLEARCEKMAGALVMIEAGHGCPSALARQALEKNTDNG